MPPASVLLGRGTVLMLVSVCGFKLHTDPRAVIPLLCVKAKTDRNISFSCANVPCMTQDWSLVLIKTKVAERVPQLTSERDQVCPLIKSHWKDEGKIIGKWTWVTVVVNTCFPLPPESKNPPVNFYRAPFDTIIIFFPVIFQALYLFPWLEQIKAGWFCA